MRRKRTLDIDEGKMQNDKCKMKTAEDAEDAEEGKGIEGQGPRAKS
jgi:hypothetical protein